MTNAYCIATSPGLYAFAKYTSPGQFVAILCHMTIALRVS